MKNNHQFARLGGYFLWLNKKARRKPCKICEISGVRLSKVLICVIINIEKVPPIDGCPQKNLTKKIVAAFGRAGRLFFCVFIDFHT